MATKRLAVRIVDWQRTNGRHHLPWQKTSDPYRVWLSEIMLQQTQVATVIVYFERFVNRFPTVQDLADADIDEVLALWAGLGYYARARNLHACAKSVVENWRGQFPPTAAALETLPGIGASTAAAIAAFCYGERVAILDGNVKRVLTRYFAISDDITRSSTNKYLWEVAQREVPSHTHLQSEPDAMTRYTQGMMDLGATVCTRAKPACQTCPLQTGCAANKLGTPQQFPVKTRRQRERVVKDIDLLWLTCSGHVLLERRPTKGVWGGLWCLPTDLSLAEQMRLGKPEPMASFAHELTHFQMVITTWRLAAGPQRKKLPDISAFSAKLSWVPLVALADYGLPKPVRMLLTDAGNR